MKHLFLLDRLLGGHRVNSLAPLAMRVPALLLQRLRKTTLARRGRQAKSTQSFNEPSHV
jgi:hypothetical protein